MVRVREERPLVSVVIPAYNQARYLRQAIDSVLGQTYQELELVVVNDGSTDETSSVLAEYGGNPRVRVIQQENAGVAAARNRGFAETRGELVCFLDADDFFAPGKIAAQVAQFERDPALGFVYCDIVTVNEHGSPAGDYSVAGQRQRLDGDILESLLAGGYFPPHCVMVRRSACAGDGPFDPALGGHADLDLWMRLAAGGARAGFLPDRLAFYRRHEGGMSRDREHMRATREAALMKLAAHHPERVARALSRHQELNEELHAANDWLKARLAGYDEARAALPPCERFDLVARHAEGQLIAGATDAVAVWEVTLQGVQSPALLLHPPATLAFTVPDYRQGRVRGAVALHPDVWDRPGCGPCRFELTVDGLTTVTRVVDPAKPGHRAWQPFSLDVPPSDEPHAIVLRTEGIGSRAHRWALWKALVYERLSD